jgi:chromate transporter
LALGLLSWLYVTYGHVAAAGAVFHGLKAAVLAIVAAAVLHLGRKALTTPAAWLLAALAFVALFFLGLPFPLVVLSALIAGFVAGRWSPGLLKVQNGKVSPVAGVPVSGRRTLKWTAVGLVVWLLPVVVLGLWQGWSSTLVQLGWFFSKAAVVTFGGAYAVLPYVGQQAVEHYQWISPGQMLDGLALAETTPGPLIMVLQFVGFLAAWQHPGGLAPFTAALLGAGLTTWVTFVPTYLFILIGAPYVERVRSNVQLGAALSAVTAAVVGVIFNLAVWFAWQVIWPGHAAVDWFAAVVCAGSFVALQWGRVGMIPVIVGCGLLGWAWSLAGM